MYNTSKEDKEENSYFNLFGQPPAIYYRASF